MTQLALVATDPVPTRVELLAELSDLLGLPIVGTAHQPPELAYTAGTPHPVRSRLVDEEGHELHLSWFLRVVGVGTVVLADSGAVLDWQRLDRWRAAVTGRPEDDFPLLRRADRQRAVEVLHQLVGR